MELVPGSMWYFSIYRRLQKLALQDEWKKIKDNIFEKEFKDLLELEKKNSLTEKGKGMLIMLRAIFEYMGWKIDDSEVL